MRDYGQGMALGKPPSPCYEHCPVMQDEVTQEHRNRELHDKLEGFRLAVYDFTDKKLRGQVASDSQMPGYITELGEEAIKQAQYCADHVARGECAILDIVSRNVNGVAVYTADDTSLHLLEGIVRPNEIVSSPLEMVSDGDSVRQATPTRKVKPGPDQAFREVLQHIDGAIRRRNSGL